MESQGLFCCRILDRPSLTIERSFQAGTKINADFSRTSPYQPKRTGAPQESDAAAKKALWRNGFAEPKHGTREFE